MACEISEGIRDNLLSRTEKTLRLQHPPIYIRGEEKKKKSLVLLQYGSINKGMQYGSHNMSQHIQVTMPARHVTRRYRLQTSVSLKEV